MQKLKRMVHTAQSTGLRKRQDKKMELLKEKCGKKARDTSETGETIAKKDLVFNSILMEINMKECGPWIKSMDKELTGEMKAVSYEENILVIGSKIKNMEEVLSFLKIATVMTVIGLTECPKEKVE